jgi:hypothetical protein
MESTTYSLSPLWAAIWDEHRRVRAARAARRSLERDLAAFSSPGDVADLDALLRRHSEAETADIRGILAARRSS